MVYFSKWKVIAILAVLLVGLAFAAPNLLDKTTAESLPGWVPNRQVNLGLDLQGGLHLLMHVEVDSVVKERVEAIVESMRVELRKANIQYRNLSSRGSGAGVNVVRPEDVGRARELLAKIETSTTTTVEGDRITVAFTDQALRDLKSAIVAQSIEIVRLRIDETGTKEPTIARQGEDRILLQLPGVDDPERVKKILNTTAKMTFHLMCESGQLDATPDRAPPGCISVPSGEARSGASRDFPANYILRRKVEVSGDRLVDSQPSFDQRTGQPVVTFRFDRVGARQFGDITAANVKKPFAIVLDNKVISAPVIQEPILGGSGQISGNFTVKDAQDLALLLRAGALPAPVTFLEERSVGPGLGADSIAAGKLASALGIVLVIVFMVVTYARFGIYADIALIANIILMLGALSALQATLTLPGIAGIVLTVGMAVDANVLIFERMREEVRNGRGPISAIDAGFQRAYTTILDSNITTLIASVILYFFGTGPIRGFAVTLSIGIVTSMFTSIMLSRLLIVDWLRRTKPKELPI